jgi:3-dehydroquinate synthase
MNIETKDYPVVFEEPLKALVDFVNTHYPNAKRYLLADSNTLAQCLPLIDDTLRALQVEQQVFNIEPGEESKSLDMAHVLWENFTELNITRGDLIINVGGGVVSDLSGFVCATYKRGVSFINLPTSLLAMADASVGGKVGVNFHQLKNQLGYFANPKGVFIYPDFLHTLSDRDFISGYAEMLKHALIADADQWKKMVAQGAPSVDFVSELLPASVAIKNTFVTADPFDHAERKVLNFGHSIGHAIETLFMDSDTQVLHGEAVAAGMICEAYLSHKVLGLSKSSLDEIAQTLSSVFDLEFVGWLLAENLALPLKHDKKNTSADLNFVLLSEIGKPKFNQKVPMELALQSFEYVQEVVG